MAFAALTEDKESLQALAFALRQDKGKDIVYSELENAMIDYSALPSSVKNSCGIDESKLKNRFANWVDLGKPDDIQSWINSSVWVANAVIKSSYIKGSDYIFYNTIGDKIFRKAFKEIAKDISKNAKNSVVRRVYSSMSQGTGDKWNPADVIAIKRSKSDLIIKEMENYMDGKPNLSGHVKEIKEQNKKLKKVVDSSNKSFHLVEDMNILYGYNQFVDKHYKSGDCVPISLKKVIATKKEIKAETTPNVKIKNFDHKESKGIKESLKLDIEIGEVEYLDSNAKCIVKFSIAGEIGHKMDIRGFQSGLNNDVQMQLQKGSAANHGKATLGVFQLITQLSGGMRAINLQRNQLRKLFPKKRIPTGKGHMFTHYDVFVDYVSKPKGDFSKQTFNRDLQFWARYLDFLSAGDHKFNTSIKTISKLYDRNPKDAAKWLKNKVQSYEVGSVIDKEQTQIKEIIKTSIMKSIYSQAASLGFRIFADSKVTDYMTSSSYLKVGG